MPIRGEVPAETVEQLRILAQRRGTSMNEVLRRAVAHEVFFEKVIEDDGKIIVQDKSGKMERVFFRGTK